MVLAMEMNKAVSYDFQNLFSMAHENAVVSGDLTEESSIASCRLLVNPRSS